MKSDKEEIISRSAIMPYCGCWIWTGIIDKQTGYAVANIDGKKSSVHRLSYRLWHGETVNGKYVCHKCDTRPCVNPDHLYLGTPKENYRDMQSRGRANPPKGEKQGKAKLTDALVLQIRSSPLSHAHWARTLGVAGSTILNARKRTFWKHLP